MKITVWISSPDNSSFYEKDIIEVPDDATKEQIENEAREVAFDHIGWGYYKTEGAEDNA